MRTLFTDEEEALIVKIANTYRNTFVNREEILKDEVYMGLFKNHSEDSVWQKIAKTRIKLFGLKDEKQPRIKHKPFSKIKVEPIKKSNNSGISYCPYCGKDIRPHQAASLI